MKSLAEKVSPERNLNLPSITVETSLFELIEAIQKRFGSDDDALVVEVLSGILENAKIRFEGEEIGRRVRLS